MKVRVYYNSKRKEYSVKAKDPKTGKVRVMFRGKMLCVFDAQFVTSRKGIDRIRRTGEKSVVAEVVGTLGIATNPNYVKGDKVRFNPYQMYTFQKLDGTPIYESPVVHMMPGGVFAE